MEKYEIKILPRYVKRRGSLAPFQEELIRAVLYDKHRLIVVNAPVGSGKTFVLKYFLMNHPGKRKLLVFLYPTKILMESQVKSFKNDMKGYNVRIWPYDNLEDGAINLSLYSTDSLVYLVKTRGLDYLKMSRSDLLDQLFMDIHWFSDKGAIITSPDVFYLMKERKYKKSNELRNYIQNSIIFIDEFHCYTGLENFYALVEDLLQTVADKVVLLSATPVIKDKLQSIGDKFGGIKYIDFKNSQGSKSDVCFNYLLDAEIYSFNFLRIDSVVDQIKKLLSSPSFKLPGAIIFDSIFRLRHVERAIRDHVRKHNIVLREWSGMKKDEDFHLDERTLVLGTSSIEVGIDMKFKTLVFETSYWPSAIQRLGRVGRKENGKVVIFTKKDFGPYIDGIKVIEREHFETILREVLNNPREEVGDESSFRGQSFRFILYDVDLGEAFVYNENLFAMYEIVDFIEDWQQLEDKEKMEILKSYNITDQKAKDLLIYDKILPVWGLLKGKLKSEYSFLSKGDIELLGKNGSELHIRGYVFKREKGLLPTKNVRRLLNPQFGYIAKSDGEPLYLHHYMVWSIFRKLSSYVPSLSDRERRLVEIACLVHDIGKMDKDFQETIKVEQKTPPHKVTTRDELIEFLEKCNVPLSELGIQSEDDIQFILDTIRTHHSTSKNDLKNIETEGAQFFTCLLKTADWLASMRGVSFGTIEQLKEQYKNKIDFVCVQCSRFSSPTLMLIVNTLTKHFKKKGWTPLHFSANTVVFAAKHGTQLPQKDEIIDEILSKIIDDSLAFQNPVPSRADRDLLVSLAKYFPLKFLEIHENIIVDKLGNKEERGFVFLKLYNDLLKALKYNPTGQRVIRLIRNACSSGESYKNKAKNKFKALYGQHINNMEELLNKLFEKLQVSDILPQGLVSFSANKQPLQKLKKTELYELLKSIAQKISSTQIEQSMRDYLNTIVLMEEDIDFKKLALNVFEKYKTYKSTADATRGSCEICGCPISYRMQPALNLPRPSQSFSQIKLVYAYRAICVFCAYDNLVLRRRVPPGKIGIYLRVRSRVPDMFLNSYEIKRLVNRLLSSTRIVRNIIKFSENPSLQNLPFPDNIEIPVGDDQEEAVCENVFIREDSMLFKLEEVSEKDFSPKDMKVKYELLYHLMKLLGFEVSIGTEGQTELFGEKVVTNEENYYKSLVTTVLAGLYDDKPRKYIFAKNMLEKAPSITIRAIGDFVGSNKLPYELVDKLVNFLIRGLLKANIIIARR